MHITIEHNGNECLPSVCEPHNCHGCLATTDRYRILESKGYKAMSERLIICSDFRWKGTVLKAKMTPLDYKRQTEGKKIYLPVFFKLS